MPKCCTYVCFYTLKNQIGQNKCNYFIILPCDFFIFVDLSTYDVHIVFFIYIYCISNLKDVNFFDDKIYIIQKHIKYQGEHELLYNSVAFNSAHSVKFGASFTMSDTSKYLFDITLLRVFTSNGRRFKR